MRTYEGDDPSNLRDVGRVEGRIMTISRRTFLKGVAVLASGSAVSFPTWWVRPPGPRPLRVVYAARIPALVPMTFYVLRNDERLVEGMVPADARKFTVDSNRGVYPGDWVRVGFEYDAPSTEEMPADVVIAVRVRERDDSELDGIFTVPGRVKSKAYAAAWGVP